MQKSIDELLQTTYWIIDILPKQVPPDSPGQFFVVEKYFLEAPQLAAVKRRHGDLILKLNCYRSVSLDEETAIDPPPERIIESVLTRYVNIRVGDALIVSAPDELYLTVYGPDEPLLELLAALSVGEGLYLWRPEQGEA